MLFDTKTQAEKSAVIQKQSDAIRFKEAIKTVKVRKLTGKPNAFEVIGR